jgi:hypothetical protein
VAYPAIYCPAGVPRPAHCQHQGSVALKAPAVGPDGTTGTTWGGAYRPQDKALWSQTRKGWWVNLAGYVPQQLVRLDVNPRILRFHLVEGTTKGHWWRVPVLLEPVDPKHRLKGFQSALDRIFTVHGLTVPPELEQLQIRLLAVANGIPLAKTKAARNRAFLALVYGLLALTQVVSEEEILLSGWASERFVSDVVCAAADVPLTKKEAKRG